MVTTEVPLSICDLLVNCDNVLASLVGDPPQNRLVPEKRGISEQPEFLVVALPSGRGSLLRGDLYLFFFNTDFDSNILEKRNGDF